MSRAITAPDRTRLTVSIRSETHTMLCDHAENLKKLGVYVDQAIREKIERERVA